MKQFRKTMMMATAGAVLLAGAAQAERDYAPFNTNPQYGGFVHITAKEVGPGQYESGWVMLIEDGVKRMVFVGHDWANEHRFDAYVEIEGRVYNHMTRENGKDT